MRLIPPLLWLALLGACSSTPSFDDRIQRREAECTTDGERPCTGDRVCLSGRCFDRCVADDECSARERCEMGVCVATGAETDAGTFDAGNQRPPCGGSCEGDTPVCDIANDECVECVGGRGREAECADGEVCDYARGECVTDDLSGQTLCSPCDTDGDCVSGEACIQRQDRNERVCLARCDTGSCPVGFECATGMMVPRAERNLCRPLFGQSCTQSKRATTLTACESPADCVPRGATGVPELCASVALPPDGLAMGNVCQLGCNPAVGCPDFPGIPAGAVVNCVGEMDAAFCVVTYP